MRFLSTILISMSAATAIAQVINLPEAPARSGLISMHQSTVRPARTVQGRAAEPLATLSESFEGTNGTSKTWLPDGWERIRTNETMSAVEGWVAGPRYTGAPAPSDGDYYMTMLYPMGTPKDEWLVTPAVAIKEGMELTFDTWFSPAYFFILDRDHYDGTTGEFIKREVASSFQIWVQPEGGEWTMVKDFVDDYMDMSYDDMAMSESTTMFSRTIPLGDYAGRTVRVGFRYKADDGNIIFLDNVRIEYPLLPVFYQAPLSTLYFGFSSTMWSASPYDVALFPVFAPVTWTNLTGVDNAAYTWRYADPVTGTESNTNDTDLTVEYSTFYQPGATSYTNYYSAPVLEGEAEGYTAAWYQEPIRAMQMGGDATLQGKNSSTGEIVNVTYGLIPFNLGTDGIDISVAPAYDYGETSVPIFGYSDRTRQWWTENSLGIDAPESDYAEAIAYLNYFEAPTSPLVVNGLWTLAKGQITDDAEFVAEIYAVSGGVQAATPVARAVCRGSEAEKIEGGTQLYLTIPFKFDSPVVLSDSEAEAYHIMISGYNDPANVTWFAPLHSMFPRLDGVSLGSVRRHTVTNGTEAYDIVPLGQFYGDYGLLNVSFAICLDAFYPWLKAENTEIEIDNASPATVNLDSYYDASSLVLTQPDGSELPSWLSASVAGRYDKAAITLTASTDAPAEAVVKIAAPGVSEQIKVKATAAGIADASTSVDSPVTGIFTPAGIAVESADAPGLYILRHADGSVSKILRK